MKSKPKGVWGENPTHINKPTDFRPKPQGPVKPIKSRFRHGKLIKEDDVSDGCAGFILILIFSLLTFITSCV